MSLHTVTSYATPEQADAAAIDLGRDGFDNDQIGVMMNDEHRGFALEVPGHNRADEGALAGGLVGIVLGGVVGFAAGPPGVVVGGSLVGLLGGSLTGGLTGTLLGGLTGLGVPRDQTEWFEKRVRAGDVLMVVTTEDGIRATLAERILERHRPATPVATFSSDPATPSPGDQP